MLTRTNKIRKNATKKMESILKSCTKVEYFTDANKYHGGHIEPGFDAKKIRYTLQDLQEGYCFLYETNQPGRYVIAYAGRCKWILETAA